MVRSPCRAVACRFVFIYCTAQRTTTRKGLVMSEFRSFGVYKVRVIRNQRQVSYSIGLPPEVAQPLAGKKFDVCVTQDGILLRPTNPDEVIDQVVVAAPEALALAALFENNE